MLTPEDLQHIRRLQLRLSRQVDAPFSGEYRSAFRGNGMEFEDVRAYVPGDDVRRIDWNVTARAGSPHIKEFREERELCLMLVCDVSASMRFGSEGVDKRRQQARISGALAYAAIRSGDRVGMLRFADGVEQFIPPKKGRGHVWRVIQSAFDVSTEGKGTSFGEAVQHLQQGLRGRMTLVFVSDFLIPEAELQPLRTLALRHSVHAFVIHDPLEESLPQKGLFYLQDSESGGRTLVDVSHFAGERNIELRVERLQKLGIHARAVSTQVDIIPVLLSHFRQVRVR